ncbi:glycosyltransferase family 4 protein [[Clostridium] fimetarium]|uniref:Glycosyltransferase involved in cell wall bisynthesis n=1 Tax=[Clostridium] fimetarium TaxID=99656 RepID=A0A1I0RM12_9FIRM|nr:glycosyltransferase family 4 protein [[Clostridium] fimetarium]SEW41979.1 Glycosyltransferase involved in cell wall bisynthesis [[Clostridium] fimetarium]
MKILIVCGSFPPAKCGVGDYSWELAKALAYEGNEVSVLTSTSYGNNKGIRIFNVIDDWKKYDAVKKIISICRKEKFDIVHLQWPSAEYYNSKWMLFCVPLLRIIGINIVLTLHEYNECTRNYKLGRIPSIIFAKKVFVVDKRFIDDILHYTPFINRNKMEYVPIGASIPKSSLGLDECNMLKYKITGDKNCFLIAHFGFPNEAKCIDVVLKSLSRLKVLYSNFYYMMICDMSNTKDSYQKNILDLIQELELEKHVIITGYKSSDDVADYLKCSDIAVLLFKNGISPRNSSFLATAEQGIKVITSGDTSVLGFECKNVISIDNNPDSLLDEILNSIEKSKNSQEYNNIGVPQFSDVAKMHEQYYKVIL